MSKRGRETHKERLRLWKSGDTKMRRTAQKQLTLDLAKLRKQRLPRSKPICHIPSREHECRSFHATALGAARRPWRWMFIPPT